MPSNWYSHVFMDPSDIEKFFASDRGLHEIYGEIPEDKEEKNSAQLSQIRGVLHKIPPREADFVELYYFHEVKQAAIAELFGVSQPTICYRLQRASKRIKYLIELPDYEEDRLITFLNMVLADPVDIEIMRLMLLTTCQSEVARSLKASQGFVRHRFYRSLKKIKEYPGAESRLYQKVFTHLSKNLNVLKSDDKLKKTEPMVHILG